MVGAACASVAAAKTIATTPAVNHASFDDINFLRFMLTSDSRWNGYLSRFGVAGEPAMRAE